jgi:hypothetical protein
VGDWKSQLEEAVAWMNLYIAPHQLVNISIFEDEHDSENGGK